MIVITSAKRRNKEKRDHEDQFHPMATNWTAYGMSGNGHTLLEPPVADDRLLTVTRPSNQIAFSWLGYEIPLFPDLGDLEWERGEANERLSGVL